MVKFFTLALVLLTFCSNLWASKLVVVQAISNSKLSFITRLGKKDGVYPGSKGTFTGKNVSIIAKATTVTRDYTQWTVDNKYANVPFIKDEIITFHNTSEYIWTLMPYKIRKKYVKSLMVEPKTSMIIRPALMTGIKQSVSGVTDDYSERGGYLTDFLYEKEMTLNIALAIGFRIEKETANVSSSSLDITRYLGLVEATYYLNKVESFYNGRFYAGLTLGYGMSSTVSTGSTTSGPALLIPAVRFGLMLPLDKQFHFIFETAFETLAIEEGSTEADSQTTNASNFKYAIGVKRYF
ncbi:MAG: hypothetical protein ACI9QD_001168 [Thermoproteota archaeon]|jgi:hypothetical protein